MVHLVFVDTNVLLNLYKSPQGGPTAQILPLIERHRKNIITSHQVEMEFKKNRQNKIKETVEQINSYIKIVSNVPAALLHTSSGETLNVKIKSELNDIKDNLNKLLKVSVTEDPICNELVAKLFRFDGQYNLTKSHEAKGEIIQRALNRFQLGYPPRKNRDTSAGDAVNWEWIIHCAKEARANVTVVSIDTDYGHGKVINDWLAEEFAERVGEGRKIQLTGILNDALQPFDKKITPADVSKEEELVNLATSVLPGAGRKIRSWPPSVILSTGPVSSVTDVYWVGPATNFDE